MDETNIGEIAATLIESVRGDLGLPDLIAARAAGQNPVLVRDLDLNPSYWLVPIAVEDRLVGFLRLGLDGDLLAYGRFGQAQALDAFPPLAYLSQETAGREIRAAFGPGYQAITSPQLVHDGPVDRIAWMAIGRSLDGVEMRLFWTFGTTYQRPLGEKPAGNRFLG
jgi:hypothetical protein